MNLWEKRSMILYFAIMNIKLRYKGSYMGFLWAVVEPLLVFILLYTVFTSLKFRTGDDFAIYLLIGITLFHIFTRGTMTGLTSLENYRHIITSTNIKPEFFPVMVTTATSILICIEVGVLFALMPIFQFVPPWTIIFLPLILILMLLLILGFSYILSIIRLYFRDIQPIWAVIAHALFFVSPIFWFVDDASQILLELHKFNPVGQLIELAHKTVIFGQIPPVDEWVYSIIFVLGVFIFGFALFQKFESRIGEIL